MSRPQKDIVEIFGHAPDDATPNCRKFWRMGGCPFTHTGCKKSNHDKSITYGVCSVTSPQGDCIVCPSRLYANDYAILKRIAEESFGTGIPFLMYGEYLSRDVQGDECIVALGRHSGKEIQVGGNGKMSMDWVLAHILRGELESYTGIEVQSIDITGNYRKNWLAYRKIDSAAVIPKSSHNLNWANVHKRLIPQLIRKGQVYAKSAYVKNGIYFVLPEIVFQGFEKILGGDIPEAPGKAPSVMTVHTYGLGPAVEHGSVRAIVPVRKMQFTLQSFIDRFVGGAHLPSSEDLDCAVKRVLGL